MLPASQLIEFARMSDVSTISANRRKYNIRVMNLCVATHSAESYITDPLCAPYTAPFHLALSSSLPLAISAKP